MYKITQKCLDLVEQLINEGYRGTVEITKSYCTGTHEVLGDALSIQLSGYCKESLHIVEDTETSELLFVGRYSIEWVTPAVEGIVESAWGFYKSYKGSGYSMPYEFEDLFKKYGYLTKKVVPAKTVWEEK